MLLLFPFDKWENKTKTKTESRDKMKTRLAYMKKMDVKSSTPTW